MKKYILLLFISTGLFAQSAGETGLSFLKIGFGARNIALGDIGVVSADNVTALNYNPALLSNYKTQQISLSHSRWLQDVSSELLGASFSLFNVPLAIGINTTQIAGIEIRNRPGAAQSTFNANYFFVSLSTGFKIAENLSVGSTIKYLSENLLTDQANGVGFDFGLYYKNLIPNLNFGASIRNLGSMNALRNKETQLPVDLRIGGDYLYDLTKINSSFYFAAGFQKYNSSNSHFNFGTEFLYHRQFAMRIGYMSGYDSKSITTGIGLKLNHFNFDYAYTPQKYELGSSHIISLMFTF